MRRSRQRPAGPDTMLTLTEISRFAKIGILSRVRQTGYHTGAESAATEIHGGCVVPFVIIRVVAFDVRNCTRSYNNDVIRLYNVISRLIYTIMYLLFYKRNRTPIITFARAYNFYDIYTIYFVITYIVIIIYTYLSYL